jgi:ATP-binding cassette subfamily F protein 3
MGRLQALCALCETAMLTLSNLTKAYAGRTLFRDASLQINRGERIGLVGPNGAGKSTLFSLILGENSPDAGSVLLERGVRLGFLPQESAPAGDETVLALATGAAEDPDSAHTLEPKAKRILNGLAFRETDFERPARTFSGGWVMRAHLARLLTLEPDLLLLDEPTNHLDLEALRWFQGYLRGYPGAILMISHDREFLNQLTQSIAEISHSRLVLYRGNYDSYLVQRAARREQQWAAYKAQQREIEALQRFADRFRAKASKASQAQSKLKQIDRMEKLEAPEADAGTVKFRFPQPARSGLKAITLQGIQHAYDNGHVTYRNLDFAAERGDRLVLVGPNGAGKSTLLKLLAGVLPFQQGERIVGSNVRVGYYAQYRVDMLNPRQTVLQEALDMPQPVSEQTARTILGSFLFRGDDAFKSVSVLSGGEKSRLALVKLLLDPPNLLLMDEPTTHLDMPSIDALIGALEQYEGTLVFISHDVHFIRALAKTVLHIDAGRLTPYAGNYDYYLEKSRATDAREALVAGNPLNRANAAPAAPDGEARTSGAAAFTGRGRKSKEQKREEAEARNALARARREREERVKTLEREIATLEGRQQRLAAELEEETTYQQPGKPLELNRELTSVSDRLARLNREWEMNAAVAEAKV